MRHAMPNLIQYPPVKVSVRKRISCLGNSCIEVLLLSFTKYKKYENAKMIACLRNVSETYTLERTFRLLRSRVPYTPPIDLVCATSDLMCATTSCPFKYVTRHLRSTDENLYSDQVMFTQWHTHRLAQFLYGNFGAIMFTCKQRYRVAYHLMFRCTFLFDIIRLPAAYCPK